MDISRNITYYANSQRPKVMRELCVGCLSVEGILKFINMQLASFQSNYLIIIIIFVN